MPYDVHVLSQSLITTFPLKLRVGNSVNEHVYNCKPHLCIIGMKPEDVDPDGRGPGVVIADLETIEDAEKYAKIFAVAPDLLEALKSCQEYFASEESDTASVMHKAISGLISKATL